MCSFVILLACVGCCQPFVVGCLGKSAMVDVNLGGLLQDSSVGVYCWGYLLLGKLGVGSSNLEIIQLFKMFNHLVLYDIDVGCSLKESTVSTIA